MAPRKDRTDPPDQTGKGEPDLRQHPLVARLSPDNESTSNPVMLIGFIGPSKTANRTRLYLNLSFDSFIDLPVAAIVTTQPVDNNDENSPTRVWVHGDTKLDVVHTVAHTIEARYVRGWIARAHMPNASPAERTMVSDQSMLGNGSTWEYSCYTFDTLCMSCTKTWVCPA